MENLLNLGFTSTRVGDARELPGEGIECGGEGIWCGGDDEVLGDDIDENSISLANFCILREKGLL